MGKTVASVVGVVAAVAITIVAPMLAPLALGVLGIAATATAVAIATAVIGLTLAVGLSLAFRALGVGAPSAKSAVGPPQIFRQSISNSFIVYGKRRVGGLLVFFHASQSGDDFYRYFVIACAGHRCQGVVDFMLGDEVVTVDGSGMVTTGKYADAAWLWFQRGLASETANATFISECGGNWTADHKGNGIAAIYAKFKMTDAVVQAGMPNVTAIIEGRDEIYDYRDGVTKYTANGALAFYDWLQMAREEGGFGAASDEIPDDDFIAAQANVCEEEPAGETGFERYQINGVIQTGAPPNEIRDVMIVNMAGSYTYSGGKHLMRPGYYVPVSVTLKEDDLAAPIQVSPFTAADAAANEVHGTFINPEDGYQGAALATQTLDAAPLDVRQIDVDLAFTTYRGQGERILRIMLNRAQAEKTVIWPMNIVGLGVKALDTVAINATRYGLSNYAWQVTNWAMAPDFGVVLNLREENEEIYDPPVISTPSAPPVITSPGPVLTPSQLIELISNSSVTGLTFSISDAGAVTISNHSRVYTDIPPVSVTGTGGTPHATGASSGDRIYIYYDDPTRAGGAVTFQHIILAGGTGDPSSAFPSTSNPGRHFLLTGLVPAVAGTTTGGSDVGSGGGTPTPYCVTVDTPIQITEDGKQRDAKDVSGELIYTQHELTGEWDYFRVVRHRIVPDQSVSVLEIDGKRLRGTPNHRIKVEGEWRTIASLGAVPDGLGDVVQMEIEDAHTYVSNGLLSHNIKIRET